MANTLDFPKYAAACLRLARDAEGRERRTELIELALTWLALFEEDAREVDAAIARAEGGASPRVTEADRTLH
jgi:hypothetical protein